MQNFYKWLLTQSDRNDIVSDLVLDIKQDSSFPIDSTDINVMREYLEMKGACSGAIDALNEAWREFGG